ncbi:M23 family metallopeptidase [Pseudorhodoplanes sp.]|uniref:M23 family metallopeptidase n=1 Tax=Pseudorhodoplanes sp. TaxID=1934341 RepID=UPI0039C8F498
MTIRTGRRTPGFLGDGELDQSRAAHRPRAEIDRIDLGNEPPLSVDGGTGMTIDRRRVSAQWFSGTILTGLCGAALMGGAVFTSLDGEAHFAASPERVEGGLRGAIAERSSGPRKADRLPPAGETNSARQVIRVSMTSRSGNREVVRVRPFVRVSSNLAMAVTELSAGIPPFNPQKMLADSDAPMPTSDTANAAEPDAEVSFVQRDLAAILPRAKIAGSVSMDEILATVREAANWGARDTNPRFQVAGLPTAARVLGYAAEGTPDPYAGFEARIVPENITLLPKNTTPVNVVNERTIVVKKGDNISSILQELGALPQEIRAIASALGFRGRDNGLKEGQRIRVLLNPVAGSGRLQPARVIIANDSVIEAVIALSDLGRYVSVDVAAMNTASVADAREDDEEEDDGRGVRLYQSIYETALRNQIPRAVIEDMIRVYSYDVDFQRKVQPGDSFDVLYAGEDETPGGAETRNDVLFAALTIGGEQKKFYRFQTPDDNIVDYYDETGKSAKKFLVRKPISDAILRSGFGVRRHPILGYAKMHTGVDWAAPHGTPIYSAGNGEVEKVGWEGGYGKYVRIRHTNGYETAYGHMTAYARGIEPGAKVRQGQVIGFVGSTGLSTGAHLHYEIMVNGRFVDPMRIRLPRGRVLENQLLTAFEAERDRLDNMMARGGAGGRVAQTSSATR